MQVYMQHTTVRTRVSLLSACVAYAMKCGAIKNNQASFFQGWQGYIKNSRLVVTNFYKKGLFWEFKIDKVNESCLVFYGDDRCSVLSAYTSCLATLVPEVNLDAKLRVLKHLPKTCCNKMITYYHAHADADNAKKKYIKAVYRPDDFPAIIEGQGFCIKWEARGVLAEVAIVSGVDEGPVIEELKKAIKCWTAHLGIEVSIPF